MCDQILKVTLEKKLIFKIKHLCKWHSYGVKEGNVLLQMFRN